MEKSKVQRELEEFEKTIEEMRIEEYEGKCKGLYNEIISKSNTGELRNFALTLEKILDELSEELKIGELTPKRIKKMKSGSYSSIDVILDVYHNNVPKEIIQMNLVKYNYGKRIGGIMSGAEKKLKKYEREARERGEPIKIESNDGKEIYVDGHGIIHIDRTEALGANGGYFEADKTQRELTGRSHKFGLEMKSPDK